ncbi:hypothetical protein [Kitasatospora sp. NPDC059571]|uniref:hypothetical protein n=1 Tax=Kitasatospora sp. NPDC059571 TaxID=3346871 RepID=UPI0036947FF8
MNLSVGPRHVVRGALVGAGAALLLTALAGCSEDKETVASWSAKGGKDHAVTIGKDLTVLGQASGSGSKDPAIAARCRQVLDDVKAAKAFRTLPDEAARRSWEETLDKMEKVTTDCLSNAAAGTGGADLAALFDVESSYRAFADSLGYAREQP